jgi:hypothetical protein
MFGGLFDQGDQDETHEVIGYAEFHDVLDFLDQEYGRHADAG